MMSDPVLIALIAGHQLNLYDGTCWGCDWDYTKVTDTLPGSDPALATMHAQHVAALYEGSQAERVAELEARVGDWSAEYREQIQARDDWRARAEKAEATVTRVEAEATLLERMIRTAPWSRYAEVRKSHARSLRTALNGGQDGCVAEPR